MPNKRIALKPVHDALGTLIRDLRANQGALGRATKNARMGGTTKNVDQWIGILEAAEREIEEWCPSPNGDPPFSIDVPPQD
jgi:hypothetical protein